MAAAYFSGQSPMASAVDSSVSTATSWDKGTAMVLPLQRISTSMSAEQASSPENATADDARLEEALFPIIGHYLSPALPRGTCGPGFWIVNFSSIGQ